MTDNYWTKALNRRISRRRALALTGGVAASAAFLAACGGDDDEGGTTPSGGTTGGASSGGSSGGGTTDTGPSVGGHLVWQGYGDPGGGLELIKARNAGVNQMASLTHDSLLDFAYGLPAYSGTGVEVLPGMATALPEISPDKLSATFKIVEGATFHDGKPVTSEDFKWTYETLAFAEESANRGDYSWLDSVEAPDPTTLVLHFNQINADILQTMVDKNKAGVLHREHHESGAAENSLLGCGPYKFVEYAPPTLMKYERNPDYWNKDNAGWFESIDRLGTSDSEKKVSDVIAGQVHVTYWFPAEERDRIQDQRDDIVVFKWPPAGSSTLYFRTDVAPFNDKRVRQALSMGFDRQGLIEALGDPDGEPDQALSVSGEAWEFRSPLDLPRADLYELNVGEAMKLMSAANASLPIKATLPTWNSTVIGQKHVDELTFIATSLHNNGLLDAEILEETFGQFGPRFTGVYDSLKWGPNVTATLPDLGIAIYRKYYWGGGTLEPPTFNESYVMNEQVDDLVTKQLEEFDRTARIALFRQLEDIVSEEMYHIAGVTHTLNYMIDPTVKNAQMPRDAYNGSTAWMKYWYFGDA